MLVLRKALLERQKERILEETIYLKYILYIYIILSILWSIYHIIYFLCMVIQVRVTGKSPPSTSRKKRTRLESNGLGYLESGEPFIQGWPSSRPLANLFQCPRQTVEEAAMWIKKARTTINHLFRIPTINMYLPSLRY